MTVYNKLKDNGTEIESNPLNSFVLRSGFSHFEGQSDEPKIIIGSLFIIQGAFNKLAYLRVHTWNTLEFI